MDAPRALVADPAFRADVLAGLAAPIPAVPARWLYDRRGSELFEEITKLPEYYPTRTETALLERYSGEIAAMLGTGEAVVEFGSGSSAKTPILLRAVEPCAYVPIDISGDFLRESAESLQAEFPDLPDLSGRGRFHEAGSIFRRKRSTACPSSASSPARRSATWSRAPRSICCAR